ncbi:MAG: DNA mismatch repair protein MutS, partial [Candidatus Marinimicrobia bacterium]|nr:DNA mismatch repair protein MutS [Candidatus Neomarinimicrobiota bacterium]
TPYQDWLADLENANHELTEHFGTVTLKGFGVDDLPLGVAAAGVALHYVHRNSPGTQVHISSLRKVSDEKFMGLDAFTVRNLELFKSLATQGTHGTLISVIDATCTAQGARLLKHWLKGPLNDKAAIEERLDRVAELVANEPVRRELRDLLRGINDLERILGRLSTGRANPRDVANLANGLEITAHIKKTLTQHELPALSKLFDHLEDTSDLVVLVRAALMDAPPINLAKGNFIRSGYNEELDELRGLASSGKKWIAELQARERQRTDIPSLKIGFNNVFGYYIEVTRTHQDKVPEDYIRKQTLVNAERYITPELKEYEEKVLTAEERSLALEKTLFDGVVKAVLERAGQVQSSARLVAMTDVAAGLAETAGRYDYCRPALSDEP